MYTNNGSWKQKHWLNKNVAGIDLGAMTWGKKIPKEGEGVHRGNEVGRIISGC